MNKITQAKLHFRNVQKFTFRKVRCLTDTSVGDLLGDSLYVLHNLKTELQIPLMLLSRVLLVALLATVSIIQPFLVSLGRIVRTALQ
jgi:hypothetical protein